MVRWISAKLKIVHLERTFVGVMLVRWSVTTAGAFTEYSIPTPNSAPMGITVGPDGALSFTETGANKIGRITKHGLVTEFSIPTADSQLRAVGIENSLLNMPELVIRPTLLAPVSVNHSAPQSACPEDGALHDQAADRARANHRGARIDEAERGNAEAQPRVGAVARIHQHDAGR
jgi:hypothetical protein